MATLEVGDLLTGSDPASSSSQGRFPSVLLYNSFADPQKSFAGYCAKASPDWKGEKSSSWPGRHSEISAPFRDGALQPGSTGDERGRGLFCGCDVKKGQPICARQPALALHQYEDSKRVCEACTHCGRFIGSLRSALCRPLDALKAAKGGRQKLDLPPLEELVEDMADLEELEKGDWCLSDRIPCEHGCGSVFCSQACVEAAKLEGWHRVFCTDLAPERRHVWRRLRAHGAWHHEPITLASQVIGEIIYLVKYQGVSLFEAMSYFTRFAKMSWLSMLNIPSRSTTQVLPKKGRLAEIADVKRQKRYEVLTGALDFLMAMVWERQFAELLTLDFFSNLVGQFSLSNVWVQLEHPLSDRLRSHFTDKEFHGKFGKLVEASSKAADALAPPEDDEKDDAKVKAESNKENENQQAVEGEKLDKKDDAKLERWWLPQYQGTGLYVCVALANHSCQPSFTLAFSEEGHTTMRALRDLKAGEELTLAYVSPFRDLNERLVHLWRTWGFVCTCQRCQNQQMEKIMEKGSKSASAAASGAALAGLSAAGVAAALNVSAAQSSPSSPSAARAQTVLPMEESPDKASTIATQRDGSEPFDPPPRTGADKLQELIRAAAEDEASALKLLADGSLDSSDDDEDEDDNGAEEEEEEEEDEEDSSSEDENETEGRALDGLNPTCPRTVPTSVLRLEEDLKKMMQILGDVAED